MKAKSKLLILLLTLALLCGILFVSVSAAGTTGTATEPTTGFGVTVNGETTDYTGKKTYADLVAYVNGMTAAAKITLYQNYTVDANTPLTFKYDGTELDLNGKTITAKTKFNPGFIQSSTGTTSGGLYVYSSKEGAKILATEASPSDSGPGGGFIFGAGLFSDVDGGRELKSEGSLTIGTDKTGTDYAGNLTVTGTCLLSVVSNTVIDGITYVNTINDNAGCIQYQLKGVEVTVRNCDFRLERKALFGVRNGDDWSATVDDSRIYTKVTLLVDKNSNATGSSKNSVTFTNTDICSEGTILNTYGETFPIQLGEGVRLNRVQDALPLNSDCVLARDNTKMFTQYDGQKYPLFYEVVKNTNAATITFKDGDTTLDTQVWKVGSTPDYIGTIALTQDTDPTKVLAPKWSMNGNDTVVEALGGTAVDATYTLVPTPKAFEATVGSTTTYYIDTAYETFCRFVQNISAEGTKIKLYTDYEIPNASQALFFRKANTELDLNGHTIKTDWKYGGGFMVAKATLYVYSSTEGAMLLAEKSSTAGGGGFILTAETGLTVGTDSTGTTAYRGNLTAKGTCLLSVSADVVLDGIYYENTVGDNAGLIQFWAAGKKVTVTHCDFRLAANKALFAVRNTTGGNWSATVDNSRIHTTCDLLVNIDSRATGTSTVGVTFTNTDIYSTQTIKNTYDAYLPTKLGDGVRMNCANDALVLTGTELTRARIDETTFSLNGQNYSVIYTVTAKANTVPITFQNGDTTLTTETWTVGNTPKYSGTITLTEGDPDSDTVQAPTGRWLIGGTSAPLTAEQVAAGETLTAVAEYQETPKAFQATIGETTYYFTDTDFNTLRNYVTNLTAPAKIKLYTNYDLPSGGYLAFNQAGSELDLNGKTLESVYKLGNGIIQALKDLNVYSTAPGAQLLATAANQNDMKNGGGFLFTAYGGSKLVVGNTNTYPMTAKGTCLVLVGDNDTTVELNGVTYVQSVADNVGYLQYNGTNNAITVNNCDLLLTVDSRWQGLFGFRRGTGGWKATVNDSRIYIAGTQQLTYFHAETKKAGAITVPNKGATFTNTVIYSANTLKNDTDFPITFGEGVKMNKAYSFPLTDGYVSAHIDEAKETLNGKDVTLLYEVVAEADAFTATFETGSTSVKETWKKDSKPAYRANVFGSDENSTYYWYVAATEGIAADTEYTAKLKTTESKITGNLTLYANITFNLYFKNDGFIKGVKYNNVSRYFTEADEKNGYYYFPISDISPKDLSEAFALEVILENDETTATYTVNTSLSKYAAAVLANEATDAKTVAGKTLVKALLDYVYEMSVEPTLGKKNAASEGLAAIKKGLDYYGRDRKTWNGTGTIPTTGNITAAGLKLASTPGFIFFLSSDYAKTDKINVTVNGTETSYEVTHEGENHYFIVSNIHVSKYTDDLTVTLDNQTFTYSLGVYMQGFIAAGKEIPAYANALYTYVLAAQAYLNLAAN